MSDPKVTDFTLTPPKKGDAVLIIRPDGTSEVYLPGLTPIEIMNATKPEWMSGAIDCLALRGLLNEDGLMDAARKQIMDQMSVTYGG